MTPILAWTKLYRDCYDSLTPEAKERFRDMIATERARTKSQTQREALALTLQHIKAMEVFDHGQPFRTA